MHWGPGQLTQGVKDKSTISGTKDQVNSVKEWRAGHLSQGQINYAREETPGHLSHGLKTGDFSQGLYNRSELSRTKGQVTSARDWRSAWNKTVLHTTWSLSSPWIEDAKSRPLKPAETAWFQYYSFLCFVYTCTNPQEPSIPFQSLPYTFVQLRCLSQALQTSCTDTPT